MKKQKSLNRNIESNVYSMKKRGQVPTVLIGIVFLVGIIGVGISGSINSINENRYVVDITGHVVYDLFKCPIKKINQTNLIYISDVDEATRKTLKKGSC